MKTGRIYKIVHSQSDICYVGSTFNTLRDRWGRHKTANINRCSITSYIQSLGAENFKIILIKEYEVEDRKHLEAYEQLWINKTKCINEINPFRVAAFYRKQYYIKNKERIDQYQTENRDQILARKRRYRESNKEKIKAYRDQNADRYKEKIRCETCNCEFTRGKISVHNKSKKHTTNLAKA